MSKRLFALAVGAGLLGLTTFGARDGLAQATGEPIAIGIIGVAPSTPPAASRGGR